MKYQVIYYRNKKKKVSKQVATFYQIEDATLWEQYLQNQGIKTEIVPVFH